MMKHGMYQTAVGVNFLRINKAPPPVGLGPQISQKLRQKQLWRWLV